MVQAAKFIDVTRTFLPINPRAYPENLHTGKQDTSPEEHSSIMAYRGYNFMPTAYGYRSYFGVSNVLDISPITAKVDSLFIYQNKAFANVLIALTDTGIWTKAGEATGVWTNTVVQAAPAPGTHTEWTSVVIADSVYVYRQNGAQFFRIDSNVLGGVSITPFTPNFLNMAAQVGIFRAAGRLAFWDTDDSIAWSNLSDFTDFTPSLETLAGNIKFSSIQGRIVTILSHGEGFMLYSTKSIVYVKEDLTSLSQWDPKVVLDSAGISYPRQAAIASPDTMHFAFTSEGIKKIDRGTQEAIVVEVSDFIKDTSTPTYLKVIEGRYLFLESMDKDFIVGTIDASDNIVESVDYVIPGGTTSIEDIVIPGTEGSECAVLEGIDDGIFPDTVPGGAGVATPAPNDAHPTSPGYKPSWTCYLSDSGIKDAANIEWGPAPCPTVGPDGVEVNMCPIVPKTSDLTETSANKREVVGTDAYIDGWTMERFVAVQSGIWEAEARAVSAVAAAIYGRTKSKSKTLTDQTSCVATTLPVAVNSCLLGRYATEFSAPKFGYSKCEFWLTRYVTGMMDVYRKMTNKRTCETIEGGTLYTIGVHSGTDRNTVIDTRITTTLAEATASNFLGRTNYTLVSTNYGSGSSYSFTYTTTTVAAPYNLLALRLQIP